MIPRHFFVSPFKSFFQANFHLLSKWFLDTSLCPLSKLFKLIFNHFPKWFSNTYQCPFSSFSASLFKCLKRFCLFQRPKAFSSLLKGFKIHLFQYHLSFSQFNFLRHSLFCPFPKLSMFFSLIIISHFSRADQVLAPLWSFYFKQVPNLQTFNNAIIILALVHLRQF